MFSIVNCAENMNIEKKTWPPFRCSNLIIMSSQLRQLFFKPGVKGSAVSIAFNCRPASFLFSTSNSTTKRRFGVGDESFTPSSGPPNGLRLIAAASRRPVVSPPCSGPIARWRAALPLRTSGQPCRTQLYRACSAEALMRAPTVCQATMKPST